jgi:hypothetical protein
MKTHGINKAENNGVVWHLAEDAHSAQILDRIRNQTE